MSIPGKGMGGSGDQYKYQVKPDLLDFLFTLALTIGIAPELVGRDGYATIGFGNLSTAAGRFDFAVFLLAIFTLLFSWYGFNASVSRQPVLYGSISGLLRFSLDALLVLLYGTLIINFRDFELVLYGITISFVLFTIWDALKVIEYRERPIKQVEPGKMSKFERFLGTFGLLYNIVYQRWGSHLIDILDLFQRLYERRSIFYALIMIVLAEYYFLNFADQIITWIDWLVLVVAYYVTFDYRARKVSFEISPDSYTVHSVTGADEKRSRIQKDR